MSSQGKKIVLVFFTDSWTQDIVRFLMFIIKAHWKSFCHFSILRIPWFEFKLPANNRLTLISTLTRREGKYLSFPMNMNFFFLTNYDLFGTWLIQILFIEYIFWYHFGSPGFDVRICRVFFILCEVFDRVSCLHFSFDFIHWPLIFFGR